MKTMFKYILILFSGLSLCGCEEKVVLLYDNQPALYFFQGVDYTNNVSQNDSIIYSFYIKESNRTRDTLYLNLRAMGIPAAQDRTISFLQTNTGGETDAIAGKHYVAFDDPEVATNLVMPVNAVITNVPLIILRDPSMKLKEFRICLQILPNEYFKVGLETQKSFLIRVSDRTAPPSNWNSWKPYFGEWGPVKMKFIIDYVGLTAFDKYSEFSQGELHFYKMKANQKLEEYNRDNKTILMEDDKVTVVTFPK